MITGSFTIGMTVLAVINLSASFFEVPTGVLSDNVGRKKTVILHLFASLISVICIYYADSTPLLVTGAVFMGLSMALKSGAISAFVYENLEIVNRTEDFKKIEGRRLALARYALVVSGLIGSALIYFFTIKEAILFTLIVSIFTLMLSFLLKDVRVFTPNKADIFHNVRQAWSFFKKNSALRNFSLGRIISRGAGNAEYRLRSLFFAAIMPEWLVNLLGIINNLFSGIAMHATHLLVQRIGILRSLVHFEILDRVLTSILVLVNTITSSIFMSIISSITYGTREVAAEDALQQHYGKNQRATMGSLIGLSGSLIYGIVAVTAGILADHIGLIYTMLLMQVLLLTTPLFFYRGIVQTKNPV